MADRKQVVDMRSSTQGISGMESNEQQRNWTNDHWQKKANDSLANYDPTRAHLNFEVAKGGTVRPIDKSLSIAQKMAKTLAERGIKDPNARPDARGKRRTVAQFILGGSKDVMNKLAFGEQHVDFKKGADNSHIVRSGDIERWAVDVYNFMAKRYGENNIVGFYVHLDESNAHVHCTVIPVDETKHRISWKAVFGDGKAAESASMSKLHDDLYHEVNQKWGMDRGSNMAETRARHRSTEEYRRDLVNEVQYLEKTKEGLLSQIHRAEIKLKGLSTMIANLQARKENIGEEIERIEQQLKDGQENQAFLLDKLAKLHSEMEDVDSKINDKKQKLDATVTLLSSAKEKLAGLKKEHSRMKELFGDDIDREAAEIQSNIMSTYNRMVATSLEPLIPTLTENQRIILKDSGFEELTEDGQNVLNCAMLLALRYVSQATAYAQSCGGGGGGNMSGWGRNKDDDDEMWWRRCIATAAAMVKPSGRKVKRGR